MKNFLLFLILLMNFVAVGCNSKLLDPIIASSSSSNGKVAEWDPEAVLPPGVSLLTFTSGDVETTYPYYRSSKSYPIKFKITSGGSNDGVSVDPGVYNVSIQYKKTNDSAWTNIVTNLPSSSDVVNTYTWTTTGVADGSGYSIRINAASVSSTVVSAQTVGTFVVDSTPPVLQEFGLTTGSLGVVSANAINRSFFSTRIKAIDLTSPIVAYCFKVNSTTAPTDLTDSCWKYFSNTQSGLNVDVSDIPGFVGFVDGGYLYRVWLADKAGNISVQTSGTGLEGKDLVSFSYNSAEAPIISNVIVNNDDAVGTLPSSSQTTFTLGQNVYVKWKLVDSDLLSYPVSIYYTTDEVNFTEVSGASALTNSVNGACTIDSNYTGCFVFPAPVATYYRLQVRAKDLSGLISSGGSQGLNLSSFSVVAGNTDLGLGGSANKAVFFHGGGGSAEFAESGILAVSSAGVVYFLDSQRGVLAIDPVDGAQKLFLKWASTSTGDGGPVSAATTSSTIAINLDYQDRLLILENGRIRRVESDGTINTIIGGGTVYDQSVGVNALEYKFPASLSKGWSTFVVLPNGNIWFSQSNPLAAYNDFSLAIFKASENKVYSWKLSGNGAYGNPERVNGADGSYIRSNVGIAFNYRTSSVEAITMRFCKPVSGGCIFWSANFNSRTGQNVGYGVHYNFIAAWTNQPYFTSRRGALYGIAAWGGSGIYKHDPNTNSWSRIVGNGTNGQCADGTVATACMIDPADGWVTADNSVYFVDRGTIRVVLPDGKVKTVFGQSKSFGNGGSPLSARFSAISNFGLWDSDDKVVLYDRNEVYLKEVSQGSSGSVSVLAGDGSANMPSIVSGKSQNLANVSGLNIQYWGSSTGFVVNPYNGEVYSGHGGAYLMTLKRSGGNSGYWVPFLGGGSSYNYLNPNSNDRAGSSVYLSGYSIVVTGIGYPSVDGSTTIANAAVEDGSSEPYIMTTTQRWNGSCHVDPFMKLARVSDGMLRFVMGGLTNPTCTFSYLPDAGTDLATYVNFPYWHSNSIQSVYMKEERAWLLGGLNMAKIMKIPFNRDGTDKIVSGGTSIDFAVLTRTLLSFTYRKECSDYIAYYCGLADGKLYKYNTTTKVESEIPLPKDASNNALYYCTSRSMQFGRNGLDLYFGFKQNSLNGIGKIRITPPSCSP